MKDNILILGAGEIGSAIKTLLEPKCGERIDCWDKDPSLVPDQQNIADLAKKANIVFLCIPTKAVTFAIKDMRDSINDETIFISVSKGMSEDGLFVDELIKSVLPENQPIALLSGPMLAEELLSGKGGAAVVAADSKDAADKVLALFSKSDLRLSYSSDVHGTAISGVMKNIYTIAVGIAHGLGFGDNMKGYVSSLAVQEMLQIADELKIDPKCILGVSGLGDFIATSAGPNSSNFTLGMLLGERGKILGTSEGYLALPYFVSKLKDTKVYPLLSVLEQVLLEKSIVKETFSKI